MKMMKNVIKYPIIHKPQDEESLKLTACPRKMLLETNLSFLKNLKRHMLREQLLVLERQRE